MESGIIADNIKQIIRSQGYKQKSIAEKAGFGETEFNNILNGSKTLKADYIMPICSALGITPDTVYGVEKGA